MAMQTPEQRVEEVELFFKNLDTKGCNVQNLLDILDILNQVEADISHKLRTAHSACGNND